MHLSRLYIIACAGLTLGACTNREAPDSQENAALAYSKQARQAAAQHTLEVYLDGNAITTIRGDDLMDGVALQTLVPKSHSNASRWMKLAVRSKRGGNLVLPKPVARYSEHQFILKTDTKRGIEFLITRELPDDAQDRTREALSQPLMRLDHVQEVRIGLSEDKRPRRAAHIEIAVGQQTHKVAFRDLQTLAHAPLPKTNRDGQALSNRDKKKYAKHYRLVDVIRLVHKQPLPSAKLVTKNGKADTVRLTTAGRGATLRINRRGMVVVEYRDANGDSARLKNVVRVSAADDHS